MITFDLPFTTLKLESLEVLHDLDPVKSGGMEKLVRMYVKFLLTNKGSNLDDPGYGASLADIIGTTTDKEGMSVKTKVIEAVSATNKWFREMQMQTAGKAEDDAMLKEGKIVSVGYEADGGKVNLRLVLINMKGRSAVFGLTL